MIKSLSVAAIHVLIVVLVWANYAWEQRTLPRAWTKTAPVDPYDPLRGRYVRLGLTAYADAPISGGMGQLFVSSGQLHIRQALCCAPFRNMSNAATGYVQLFETVSFFIPEHIPDPSQLAQGDELWVELTVPATAAPRPLRLALKKKAGEWIDLKSKKD